VTDDLTINVNGLPAPQGSKRYVGNGRMVESSKAVGPWRDAVRSETQRTMNGNHPVMGPVDVYVAFKMPRPKGHLTAQGARRTRSPDHPTNRPDVDKLARATLDGLTEGGAWLDDAQVINLHARKRYADPWETPGALILIRPTMPLP